MRSVNILPSLPLIALFTRALHVKISRTVKKIKNIFCFTKQNKNLFQSKIPQKNMLGQNKNKKFGSNTVEDDFVGSEKSPSTTAPHIHYTVEIEDVLFLPVLWWFCYVVYNSHLFNGYNKCSL
jgi:hypothetical protein